jgi:hypothetical protein
VKLRAPALAGHIHLDPANKNILIDKSDRPCVDPIVDGDEEISSRPSPGPIWRYDECAENKPLIPVGKEIYYVSGCCWSVRRWDLHPLESVGLLGAHRTSRQERWPSKGFLCILVKRQHKTLDEHFFASHCLSPRSRSRSGNLKRPFR